MDQQHPIPQDVTGFQFKLIGDMTIKQFAYLAAGVLLAWLTYSLPLFWLLKYPIVLLFAGLGVALAFIPIEGRPFDIMLTNFLKAFITPNQYVFQKTGHPIIPVLSVRKLVSTKPQEEKREQQHQSADKLQKYLHGIHKDSHNALDDKEMRFLGTLSLQSSMQQPDLQQPVSVPQAPLSSSLNTAQGLATGTPMTPDGVGNTPAAPNEALEKEAAVLQQELAQAKQEEAVAVQAASPTSTAAHEKVTQLEQELTSILMQKNKLQDQLVTLKKELALQKQQVFTPTAGAQKPMTQNVRTIQQGQGKAAGLLAAPEAPNLLTGVIKDSRNNSLPNILVEVKDKDGNPVRAFKTNGLGQFAAATQLANGIYTITFEDPLGKHTFDAVEITATGDIIYPLEIISVDAREQLRQELFKA